MKFSLISLLWLLLLAPVNGADNAILPKPSKYIVDNAGVLKDGGAMLNEQLRSLEDTTTAQLVVYIDKKLPANTTIEDVAVKSFRSWGVGQKDKNNGLALFIFVDDRKMRLEVGYGLEGRIPDLVAKRVLDTMLKPAFKQQRYGEGINAAVNELIRLVHAETTTNGKPAVSKESQRGPFGGSASSLPLSSSSASTAQSSTSSSSNSSDSSSAVSSALPVHSPGAEVAVGAEAAQPTGTKYLWWLLIGVLLTAGAVWAYLLNDLTKKEARNKQAKLDRQLELERQQREEAARQRRLDAQKDSVLFQAIPKATIMPKPSRFGNSSVPLIKQKPVSKPLVAVTAVAGVAALSAAEMARRRRQQEEADEAAERSRRRRRQEDDDDSSRRSSYSSSDSSSSSSSSFDSGGGDSGGGGASSDW